MKDWRVHIKTALDTVSLTLVNLGKITFAQSRLCFSLAQKIRMKSLRVASNSHWTSSSLSGLCLYPPTEMEGGSVSDLHKCLLRKPIPTGTKYHTASVQKETSLRKMDPVCLHTNNDPGMSSSKTPAHSL